MATAVVSDPRPTKKRKRTKNTSTEQYSIYLQFMESDYHFRSGTINPTLGENYLEQKWEELSNILNAVGDGPHLSVDEWKKRFTDWKYAVRVKHRKLTEHRKKTGSGPESEIKLPNIEERALGVWGKVVVTGTPHLNDYDGLSSIIDTNQPQNAIIDLNNASFTYEDLDTENLLTNNNISNVQIVPLSNPPLTVNSTETSNETGILIRNAQEETNNHSRPRTLSNPRSRLNSIRPKPLSFLTEKLLESSKECQKHSQDLNNNIKQFSKEYITVLKEKNEIEKLKLQFEIAKYKFENPAFNFKDNEIDTM